jgi:hypothetical protein
VVQGDQPQPQLARPAGTSTRSAGRTTGDDDEDDEEEDDADEDEDEDEDDGGCHLPPHTPSLPAVVCQRSRPARHCLPASPE